MHRRPTIPQLTSSRYAIQYSIVLLILILNRVLSVAQWDILAAEHNKFKPAEINNIRKIRRPKKVKIKLPKRGEEENILRGSRKTRVVVEPYRIRSLLAL